MQAVLGVILAVLFGVTCVLALVRIVRGPSILDRLVGNEIITAAIICGVGAYMALTSTNDLLVVLLALAIFSSAGSISVARYVTHTDRHAATLSANPRLAEQTAGGSSAQADGSDPGGSRGADSGDTGADSDNTGTGPGDDPSGDPHRDRAPREGEATPEDPGPPGETEAAVHPDEVQEGDGR